MTLRAYRPDGQSTSTSRPRRRETARSPHAGRPRASPHRGWVTVRLRLATKNNNDPSLLELPRDPGERHRPDPNPDPDPDPDPDTNAHLDARTNSDGHDIAVASPSVTVSARVRRSGSWNFGQLDNPRADEQMREKAFPLNIAQGIDHQLMPYVFPSTSRQPGTAAPGPRCARRQARHQVSRPGTGELHQGDTGNDGRRPTPGSLRLGWRHRGRLDASRGNHVP